MNDRLLRRHEVCSLVGMPKSTLYANIARGAFPAPVRIGRRSVAWSKAAIDGWINETIQAGRAR